MIAWHHLTTGEQSTLISIGLELWGPIDSSVLRNDRSTYQTAGENRAAGQ
jgi:hypothetical protein